MAKEKAVFECTNCGHQESRWVGRCPGCQEWGSLVEQATVSVGGERRYHSKSCPLSSLEVGERAHLPSGISEFDRVLGGGIMIGSSVLVGGEPGIGKSTLMLQCADHVSRAGRIVYISGEESPRQVKLRASRLGVSGEIELLCNPNLALVFPVLEQLKPILVIVDSIQTLISDDVGRVPGGPNQLKYCCQELISWARGNDSAIFLVAHVTKEGSIAGPKVIEHMVDTVLYFDNSHREFRFLRATKNRFGSIDEIALFTMTPSGLNEVEDPSSLFLVERKEPLPSGVVVTPVFEGSRVLMIEIQALTVAAQGGLSRTFSDRIDPRRVSRIAAVIERHVGVRIAGYDLYINVAGGIQLKETGIDLAVAIALYSARKGIPVPKERAVTGELSLTGEVRPVPHMDKRLKSSMELGFSPVIPKQVLGDPVGAKAADKAVATAVVTGVYSLEEAIKVVFGGVDDTVSQG